MLKPNCIYATPLPKQKKENNRAYTLSLAHKHRHQKRAMKTTSRTNKIKSYVWSNRLICSNDEERYLNLTVFFLFSFSLSINCKYKTLCVLYVAHHNTANRIQLVWMGLEMYMRTIRENDRGDISVWNLLPDFGQVWVCSHVSAVVCVRVCVCDIVGWTARDCVRVFPYRFVFTYRWHTFALYLWAQHLAVYGTRFIENYGMMQRWRSAIFLTDSFPFVLYRVQHFNSALNSKTKRLVIQSCHNHLSV